jgi:hypothetical protein
MKALSYCKPLLWEAKNKSCSEIYWKKNILRCTFTGKKYLSCSRPWAEKNYCTVWIFKPPPPSKIKWSAPYCEEYASEVPFPILIIIVIAFFFIGLTMWIDIQVSSLPTLAKDAEKFHEALIVYPRYLWLLQYYFPSLQSLALFLYRFEQTTSSTTRWYLPSFKLQPIFTL